MGSTHHDPTDHFRTTRHHRGRAFPDFQGFDLGGADDDGVLAVQADILGKPAQDRVEFEHMRQRGVIGDVVDGHHLDIGAAALGLLRHQGRVEVASDAAGVRYNADSPL